MPYGGSGANKAPIGQLNPILLGQRKETGGTSLLAQHLNKKREKESERPRQPGGFTEGGPWDNQQSNYRQQGNYNQQDSYDQHQGGFGQQQGGYNQQQQGGYNQQQGGYGQHGQYNQQRDYNNQSSFNPQSQNYGETRQYESRNQQSRPYNQGPPSQPPAGPTPYNQYQSTPPLSGNQSSSYGSGGGGFQRPPPNFSAPPPNSNMPPVQGFPPSGFIAPPPPLPKTSGFNQLPPSFGGPPPPQGAPTNAPPPPAPSSNSEQPPLPATAANRVGREGRDGRSSPPKKRKKRSRWGDMEERIQIPGLPSSLPVDATQEQKEEYMLHFKIEEISIKLRSGDLGIPDNPEDRSPSPEPIYNTEGKRLNTREYRVRKRLEEERHTLVQQASMKNPEYKPPVDYRPPSNRMQEKVMIPQDANPAINFIGLLIGPRGNTLKKMEKDTNCKIIIRGKGSVKEGKGRPGFPLPGENEPLHALVTGPTVEEVKNAVKVIEKIIKEGVETPEGSNELRKMQLRELAALNGTLIEEDIQRCRNCGATDHRHWECTEVKNITSQVICTKCGGYGHVANDCTFILETGTTSQPSIVEKAKMDDEYMSLMAELGVDAPVPKSTPALTPALTAKQEPTLAIAPPPSSSNDQTPSKGPSSSAPWSVPHEPKPLMSVNPSYTPRATPPKPLMSSQAPPPKALMTSGGPPGHGSPWSQQRGPPPHDLGAQRPGGPRGPAPPWAQGPGTPSSNMRGPPPPAPTGPPSGPPPPGAPPPWQAGPPPPWQQTPPPPATAAPYASPVGYGVPPRGVMYPQMGQLPPMPPWSAPPPPPPPPS